MDDRHLYQTILGLSEPWFVSEVEVRAEAEEILVHLALPPDASLRCPDCGAASAGYDRSVERRWRHLDTCQYQTVLTARVPRVRCGEHGVKQIAVPWAEDRSRFTALFEALAIRLLKETTVSGLATIMDLSWDEASGILQRAVERGLARREADPARFVGVDETSFAKRHEYVTVVADLKRPRLPQPGQLPTRDPVPLRKTQHEPTLNPEEPDCLTDVGKWVKRKNSTEGKRWLLLQRDVMPRQVIRLAIQSPDWLFRRGPLARTFSRRALMCII